MHQVEETPVLQRKSFRENKQVQKGHRKVTWRTWQSASAQDTEALSAYLPHGQGGGTMPGRVTGRAEVMLDSGLSGKTEAQGFNNSLMGHTAWWKP